MKHFPGVYPTEIAFVGDRALTDVVFGNNEGMLTILTRDVVTEEGDNPMAIRVSGALMSKTWIVDDVGLISKVSF